MDYFITVCELTTYYLYIKLKPNPIPMILDLEIE